MLNLNPWKPRDTANNRPGLSILARISRYPMSAARASTQTTYFCSSGIQNFGKSGVLIQGDGTINGYHDHWSHS